MAEYIERDKWIIKPTITETIENLSTENEVRYRGTVTVSMQEYRPVVHGHWIVNKYPLCECSRCGELFTETWGGFDYCPKCGATMDEVDDDG